MPAADIRHRPSNRKAETTIPDMAAVLPLEHWHANAVSSYAGQVSTLNDIFGM
jgi:hypothetical protein